jgi:hypothetical protein
VVGQYVTVEQKQNLVTRLTPRLKDDRP